MVIAIILILLSVCLFLGYCIYSTFSESNFDIINDIRYDKKGFLGFFVSIAVIIVCLVGIYFCCITPTSFIRNEYVHKNGTMTVVEYSLTGDSTINTDVKLPKTTYGTVKEVKFSSILMGKIWYYYTNVTVQLNDGRVLYKKLSGKRMSIKKGNGMSLTEKFYPYYEMEFTFN